MAEEDARPQFEQPSPELVAAVRETAREPEKAGGKELDGLRVARMGLENKAFEDEIALKKEWAAHMKWLLIAQLLVVDVVFVFYAKIGVHWKIPENVLNVWLSATVVEVIGIVFVITRHLFP